MQSYWVLKQMGHILIRMFFEQDEKMLAIQVDYVHKNRFCVEQVCTQHTFSSLCKTPIAVPFPCF
jgi:hypothetical protein